MNIPVIYQKRSNTHVDIQHSPLQPPPLYVFFTTNSFRASFEESWTISRLYVCPVEVLFVIAQHKIPFCGPVSHCVYIYWPMDAKREGRGTNTLQPLSKEIGQQGGWSCFFLFLSLNLEPNTKTSSVFEFLNYFLECN